MTVIAYCTEEVRRQDHDIHAIDGLQRVAWMLGAWTYAMVKAGVVDGKPKPDLADAIILGRMVEPHKNIKGIRTCGVRVRARVCPPASEVPGLLERLFERRDEMTPMEFYRRYEEIHPFVDGNGRSGKCLLNWIAGTLSDPIFPPNDLFGDWIVNP